MPRSPKRRSPKKRGASPKQKAVQSLFKKSIQRTKQLAKQFPNRKYKSVRNQAFREIFSARVRTRSKSKTKSGKRKRVKRRSGKRRY